MKTTIVSFALVTLLSVGAFANPRLSKKSKAKAVPVQTTSAEQQLSTQLTYPEALMGANHNSVVVVQYRIDDNNRVSDVQVMTANKQLNRDLTRQLTGVKINTTEVGSDQLHTARLRFQVQ